MSECRRCHRALSNKKSVQHGFGPVCWNKLNAEKAVDIDVSCLEHLDSTDAGGEPGDVGYKSLAERESEDKDTQIWTTAHGRTVII